MEILAVELQWAKEGRPVAPPGSWLAAGDQRTDTNVDKLTTFSCGFTVVSHLFTELDAVPTSSTGFINSTTRTMMFILWFSLPTKPPLQGVADHHAMSLTQVSVWNTHSPPGGGGAAQVQPCCVSCDGSLCWFCYC